MTRFIVATALLTSAGWFGWSWSPADEATGAEPASDPAIERLLTPIRARHKLPAAWGGIVSGQELTAAGVVGVRKMDEPTPATLADRIHLGSCTKAMTATLLAMLIEEKQLAWESTLGEVFAENKAQIDKAYQDVTLWQLVTHTSGAPANTNWWNLEGKTTTEQRRTLLKREFGKPPTSEPGTEFLYSNVGYAIAGLMAEQVTGKSWESLLNERLFQPLEMNSAGFGPPGTKGEVDQPWGHIRQGDRLMPHQFDNSPPLGPAGTVHCSLADWGKFISLHLAGAREEKLSPAALLPVLAYERLHTPPEGREYAAGWVIADRPWAKGRVLTHAGSNTMWFCVTWLAPERNFAVVAATNLGGDEAEMACDEIASALIGHHLGKR